MKIEPKELRKNFKSSSGKVQRQAGELPIGQLYEVEGRHLMLHHSGTGSPAVVFLPGAGLTGLGYLNIHNQISQFTTSVLYDRGGTGWSDEVKLPRTAIEVTDELRGLLRAAGVPAPYLLVGHSLGGLYIQRYAQRFPDEVAGILLLDPIDQGYYTQMPKQTLLDQLRQGVMMVRVLLHLKAFYRPLFQQMFSEWPDSIRETLIEYHLRSWRTGMKEGGNAKDELFAAIRDGGGLPDVPLILLSSMGIDAFQTALTPEPFLREVNNRKRVFYTAFAKSVPQGEYREIENAGHSTIHTSHPDAVVQAIRDLLNKVNR